MSWERTPQKRSQLGLAELRDGIKEGTLVLRPDGRVDWTGRGILKPDELTPEARTWLEGYLARQKKPKR